MSSFWDLIQIQYNSDGYLYIPRDNKKYLSFSTIKEKSVMASFGHGI